MASQSWKHCIYMTNDNEISSNIAIRYGGAVYLVSSSLWWDIFLNFTHNVVTSGHGKGGAIYILDNNCEELSKPYSECSVLGYDFEPHYIDIIYKKQLPYSARLMVSDVMLQWSKGQLVCTFRYCSSYLNHIEPFLCMESVLCYKL